jgi:hypothetical protein
MVCFQIKNPNLGKILDGLALEDDGIFYRHLVHFTAFCSILWTFGIVRVNLVYFFPFWYLEPRKIWQPWFESKNPSWPLPLCHNPKFADPRISNGTR